MATNNKNRRKWEVWEGAFRAAAEGGLGVHYGSHVWTLEAAQARREALEPFVTRSWVETYVDGTWKRVGVAVVTTLVVVEAPKPED